MLKTFRIQFADQEDRLHVACPRGPKGMEEGVTEDVPGPAGFGYPCTFSGNLVFLFSLFPVLFVICRMQVKMWIFTHFESADFAGKYKFGETTALSDYYFKTNDLQNVENSPRHLFHWKPVFKRNIKYFTSNLHQRMIECNVNFSQHETFPQNPIPAWTRWSLNSGTGRVSPQRPSEEFHIFTPPLFMAKRPAPGDLYSPPPFKVTLDFSLVCWGYPWFRSSG